MIVCLAGDVHGNLHRFYDNVFNFKSSLGVNFSWIIQVGDLGIWPDPMRIDSATKHHGGPGDFPKWLNEGKYPPIKTAFVKGNHEDYEWLDSTGQSEVMKNLFYIKNGTVFQIEDQEETLNIFGIGGCYGPSDINKQSSSLQSKAKRHYTFDEIDKANEVGLVDIVVTHDAPKGVVFPRHRRGIGWVSDADGLDRAISVTSPIFSTFGHHHTRVDSIVNGISHIGLNKLDTPGHLVVVNINSKNRIFDIIGESPMV